MPLQRQLFSMVLLLLCCGPTGLAKEIRIIMPHSIYLDQFLKIGPAFEKKTGHTLAYLQIKGPATPELIEGLKTTKARTIRIDDYADAFEGGKRISGTLVLMTTVLRGTADAAAAHISFSEWARAYRDKYPDRAAQIASLTHRVIGHDLIRILAHKGIGVHLLSAEQIEALFTGRIKNWKEVGGKDIPVQPIVQVDHVSRVDVFEKNVLGSKKVAPNAIRIESTPRLMEALEKNPGGFSFTASGDVKLSVAGREIEVIETGPIGRPITLITKGRPSEEVQQLIQFAQQDNAH